MGDQSEKSETLAADAGLIDRLCDEFEQALRNGGSPQIEEYLSRLNEPLRASAIRDLLQVEIELRRGAGEAVREEDYLPRFSAFEKSVLEACHRSDVALATIQCESPVRPCEPGAATRTYRDSDSGSGRLEVRCPSCHSPTEVAVDTALTDLTCSSCGSHFSLVDQTKATRLAPSLSKLGRFELIERLGVGGFGSVWKARDKELDRSVAIKIPRAGVMTAEEQEKFFREARAAAQLRHPNIVSVHEVGRDQDSVYIVSDFVRGVTVSDWLTSQKLTSREAAELCAKIAEALHHAHEQGVVHRDLKPANIIIDGNAEPHLMDFGLARRDVGEVTVTVDGQILGTPAYMSPEQAQGEAHTADRRSDVYSLGVILFQLLTGELPFRGNARMIMHQVINDEPPSPRKLNANISKDLETITLKCLEKDASRRYHAAAELAAELRRYIRGEPIQARPINRPQRVYRWAKRHPAVAVMAAATVSAIVFGVAGIVWQWRKAEVAGQLAAANADREQVARNAAQQRSAELDKERRQLLDELHVSNLLRADSLFHQRKFADAEKVLWHAMLTQPSGHDRRAHWALRRLYRESPRIGVLPVSGHVLAISQDGKRLVSADNQKGNVSVYDIEAGRVVATFTPGIGEIFSIAISSTGGMIACGYESGGVIEVWDVSSAPRMVAGLRSKKQVKQKDLDTNLGVRALMMAGGHKPDEVVREADHTNVVFVSKDSVISSDDVGLYAWDVASESIRSFDMHPRYWFAFPSYVVSGSLDGGQLLTTEYGESKTGDADQGIGRNVALATINGDTIRRQPLFCSDSGDRIATEPLSSGFKPLRSRAIAIDSKWSLLAIQQPDESLALWDFKNRKRIEVKSPPKPSGLEGLWIAEDSKLLIGYANGSVYVWDLPSLKLKNQFTLVETTYADACLNSKQDKLLIADDDGNIGTYQLSVSAATTTIGKMGHVAAFGKAGPSLQAVYGSPIIVWDGSKRGEIDWRTSFDFGTWRSIAISPNGKTAALAVEGLLSSAVELFDTASLKRIATIALGSKLGYERATFSDSGDFLAVLTRSGLAVIDVAGRKIAASIKAEEITPFNLAFSADGSAVAVMGKRRTPKDKADFAIQLYDLKSERKVAEISGESFDAFAFSPSTETQLLAICENSAVGLCDARQLQRLATLTSDNQRIYSVAFSSDGNLLTTGHADGTLRIWDVKTRVELIALKIDGEPPVKDVVFTNDNDVIRCANDEFVFELHLDHFDKHIDGHRSHFIEREVRDVFSEQGREAVETFIERLQKRDPGFAQQAREELARLAKPSRE